MFTLNNKNQVVISSEYLLIPEFNAIWLNDKTRHKEKAMKEFTYIYFVADFKSDYRRTGTKETIPKMVSEEVLLDPTYYKKIPKRVTDAIEVYNKLQNVKSLQLFEMSENILEQTLAYLKEVDKDTIAENYDKIYKMQSKIPTLILEYEKHRKMVENEVQETKNKTKEQHELGDRENYKAKEY